MQMDTFPFHWDTLDAPQCLLGQACRPGECHEDLFCVIRLRVVLLWKLAPFLPLLIQHVLLHPLPIPACYNQSSFTRFHNIFLQSVFGILDDGTAAGKKHLRRLQTGRTAPGSGVGPLACRLLLM